MQEFLPIADKEWFNYRMQLKMKFIIPAMTLSLIFLLLIPLVQAEATFFDQDDAFIMGNSPTDSRITGGGGGRTTTQNQTVLISYPSIPSVPRPQQEQQEAQEQIPGGQEVETAGAEDSGGLVTGALTESPLKGDVIYAVLALVLTVVLFFAVRSLEESTTSEKYAYRKFSRIFKKKRFR
jgi:hypothetical protein